MCAPSRFDRVNYSVVTFGCRVNQANLGIEEELRARGRRSTRSGRGSRCRNTCSVTATADQGAGRPFTNRRDKPRRASS